MKGRNEAPRTNQPTKPKPMNESNNANATDDAQPEYECVECGNNEWFYYPITGTGQVRYHPETGEPMSYETLDTEPNGEMRCSECDGAVTILGGQEASH